MSGTENGRETKQSNVPRGWQELVIKLRDQLLKIHDLAALREASSKRIAPTIATCIRVIVRDGAMSRSLLRRLCVEDQIKFHDSDAEEAGKKQCFVPYAVGQRGHSYLPDARTEWRPVPFDTWWNSVVITNAEGQQFSRCSLVMTMTNKDGGAHVDDVAPADYYDLAKTGAFGSVTYDGADTPPVLDIASAAVYWIGVELNETLRQTPELPELSDVPSLFRQKREALKRVGRCYISARSLAMEPGGRIEVDEVEPGVHQFDFQPRPSAAANRPCPCGSGRPRARLNTCRQPDRRALTRSAARSHTDRRRRSASSCITRIRRP